MVTRRKESSIEEIMYDPMFVPETKKIDELDEGTPGPPGPDGHHHR